SCMTCGLLERALLFLPARAPPCSTLFPYTTLFRSRVRLAGRGIPRNPACLGTARRTRGVLRPGGGRTRAEDPHRTRAATDIAGPAEPAGPRTSFGPVRSPVRQRSLKDHRGAWERQGPLRCACAAERPAHRRRP